MNRVRAAAVVVVLLAASAPAVAAVNACTNPGKDGPATALSGIVNSYYAGVSGTAGASVVTIGAVDTSSGGLGTPIAAGDLILVMQMQDADILSSNDSSYGGSSPGSGHISLNNAGVYEYAVVATTYAGGTSIPLTAPLQNSYRTVAAGGTSGQRTFQVIRVPQYSSVVLSGTLTAAAWNGSTGGVLAVDVGGQLSWNGQTVDVTGRGFRGGGGMWLKGRDATQPAYAASDYVATLLPLAPTISPNPSTTAGPFRGAHAPKGEGIAGTPRYLFVPSVAGTAANAAGALRDTGIEGYPNGSMGRGAPGNAGGGGSDGDPAVAYNGGNDQNTGGGGGGGYAGGGSGGYGWTPNTPPGSLTGGFGGEGVPMSSARLTLGGGGGAGTSNNATGTPNYAVASSGAAGGGVAMIRAKTIVGSGTINARGTTANQTVCNDASGGGGGGGAVLVYASGNNGNVGTVTINANGGGGGSNTGNGSENSSTCGAYNNEPHGPGGGGGGGFVVLSSISNATINVQGGPNGTTSPSNTSTAPYGSSTSPGGFQINSIVATDLPGATPSPLCFPLLTVSKVTTRADTVQGATTSYTLTVSNAAGYGTATGVVLKDVLPVPLTFATTDSVTTAGLAARTSVANPAAGAAAPSWGAFTIPGGGSVTVSFTASVPAATPLGTLQNGATVAYDDPTRSANGQTVTPGGTYSTGDFVLGSNYAAASSTADDVTIRQPASIGMGFSPVSINPGGTTVLSIVITNPNGVPLSGAAFNDAFPAGLTAVGGAVTVTGSGCTGFTPAAIAAGSTSFAESGGTIPAGATCTFSVTVTASTPASYTTSIAALSFTNNLNVTNTSAGAATLLTRPSIAKSFVQAAVPTSTSATVQFVVTNANSVALTGANFTDSLPAGLVTTGGAVTVTGAGCSGFSPASVPAALSTITLSGGSLAAGAVCTIRLGVQSPAAGNYANTAGGVTTTETVATGAPSNTAQLGVGTIGVAKSFSPARIASGGVSTVSIQLQNPTGVAQTAGAFSDTLTGMSVSGAQTIAGCAGITPSSLTAGQTNLDFTSINIPAAGCTLTFTVTSNTPGTQTNTTSGVRTALLPAGPPSNTAALVVTSPPTISNAFNPAVIQTGGIATLVFTLLNADTILLTSAAFTDVLNGAIAVAGSGTVAAGGTCSGASSNTFSAGVAGATLSFSGVSIPQGAGGCTVTIPVTSAAISPAAGYANATSGVSSAEASTGAASNTARLTVASAPSIAAAFAPASIAQGATTTLTFTLTNASNLALTGATFTDLLANMQIATTGSAGGTCAGAAGNTFTAGDSGTLTLAGITIPAAGSCTVSIPVTSSVSGTNPNAASGVTTAQTPLAGSAAATANLVVYSPPQVSLGFNPGSILTSAALATSRTTLTLTLRNTNAVALTSVAFGETLANMRIYAAGAAGGTCTGAAGNGFAAGATNLSFSGLTVPANGTCTVTVQVASANISPAAGWPAATTGATSAQTPLAGAPSPSAFLNVLGYVTISEVFSPASIASGGTSTITFTLTNPNGTSVSAASFSDTFPANVTTDNAAQSFIGAGRGTCTGAIPSAGSATPASSVSFTGISIPANSSCTVLVDVTSSATGNYTDTASGVTTAETGAAAGPASNSATLTVGRISITKSFAPAGVGVGETTTLTFVLKNSSGARSGVAFSDTFPANMTVASPPSVANGCNGTIGDLAGSTTTAGDTGVRLTGGTMVANGTCTISVDVTVSAAGSFANTTTGVSATGFTTGPLSNTATLLSVVKPSLSEAFAPATLDAYRNSSLTFTLTNPNASTLTNCAFSDTLAGFFVSNPPAISGTCTGVTSTPALAYGRTALSFNVPALNAGNCTIIVPVTSSAGGTYPNAASGLKCDQIVNSGAASPSASVTFNKLPIQLLKSANVSTVTPGSNVTYTLSYANPNPGMSLQNIVISDTTPQFTGFTSASCGPLPASLTSCSISAPAVGAAGAVTWTFGGSLDPGVTGTVTLTVTVK